MSTTHPRFDPVPFLARHLVGLVVSSQAAFAVALHAGWVFLLLAALLIPHDAGTAPAAWLGGWLLRALEWIGAMQRDGGRYHADLGTVGLALAKLAPLVYLLQLGLAFLRRDRPAWSMGRKTLLSVAIAALGYGAALALLPDDAQAGLWWMGLVFVALVAPATFWALLARRAGDAVLRHVFGGPAPA